MIKNASGLLAAFMAAEKAVVDSFDMPHMPTLGSAYEHIVMDGIDQKFILPPRLDLRVVTGFIAGLDNQIDAMLVQGEGVRYGRTDKFIYPIDQVLCVVEVKKTMSKEDLDDGIGHLADVQKHFLKRFAESDGADDGEDVGQAYETFTKLTGRAAPSPQELDLAPVEDRLLLTTLVRQMFAPMTVLLGFEGYSTEHGLREAFLDVVEAASGQETTASPDLLPSLISVGDLSLVKCSGQPYVAWDEADGWVLFASTRHNAALVLLEFLWTKIERFCKVKMPFGPEVEMETLEKVMTANAVHHDGRDGWYFNASTKKEKQLRQRPPSVRLEPIRLSAGAISLTNQLLFGGGVIQLNQKLRDYIRREHGEDLSKAAAELVRTSAFRLRGDLLQAIPPIAFIATLDDGTGYAGPRREPLEQWCDEHGLSAMFTNIVMLD